MSERRARLATGRLWLAALVLAAIYALPLFLPPGPASPAAPAGGLLARMFPGVPAGWVLLRLVSLAAAAGLAARAAVDPQPGPSLRSAPTASAPSNRRLALALAVAAATALGSLRVDDIGRGLQIAWLASLALPALVLWWRAPRAARLPGGLGVGVLALVGVWLVSRAAVSWRAPRAANLVDTWSGFLWLAQSVEEGRNVLAQGFLVGKTSVNLVLQGALFMSPGGLEPSFAFLQVVHLLWMAAVTLGVARLAARSLGPTAAPVAAAVFAFSPFVLMLPLTPTVIFVGPVFTVGILLLLDQALRRDSAAALAGLGPWAGLAGTNPALVPLAGLALGWAALANLRRRPGLVAVAALGFAAALAPAIPGPEALRDMLEDYTGGSGEWVGLESVMLGQRTPFDVPELWKAGRPGPLDIPLAALLSPFAIARQPIRLWGDALLDPLGGALAALGIALALRRARRDAQARLWLLALAACIVPAFASSYDRPSLSRSFGAPVVLALLAGLGFEGLRQALAPTRTRAAAWLAAGAIALGGSMLFDVVNPRILRASWLGIALEALEPHDTRRPAAAVLAHGGDYDLSWLHVGRIASQVPARPLPWLPFEGPESLARAERAGVRILLWSPALEADAGVRAAVCARWPDATLHTLSDRTGSSDALAASISGQRWSPALAAARVETRPCPPRRSGKRFSGRPSG